MSCKFQPYVKTYWEIEIQDVFLCTISEVNTLNYQLSVLGLSYELQRNNLLLFMPDCFQNSFFFSPGFCMRRTKTPKLRLTALSKCDYGYSWLDLEKT